MWLIAPLIFFLSWRSCRSIGQAFSETAAWALGYFATAGLILMFNWGNVELISDRPDGPGAAIAIIGGFVGMLVSRYLWKRRGGHLNRKPSRLGRAMQAMRSDPAPAKRSSAGASARPRTASATARPASSGARPRPSATDDSVQKAMSNKWVRASARALGAMLSDDDAKKRSRR